MEWEKSQALPCQHIHAAVTRIRTWVASATTKSTNHYTITAIELRWRKEVDFCPFLLRQLLHCSSSSSFPFSPVSGSLNSFAAA